MSDASSLFPGEPDTSDIQENDVFLSVANGPNYLLPLTQYEKALAKTGKHQQFKWVSAGAFSLAIFLASLWVQIQLGGGFSPDETALSQWAISSLNTSNWPLLTSMFLSVSVGQWFFNVVAVTLFGSLLVQRVGLLVALSIYVMAGLISGGVAELLLQMTESTYLTTSTGAVYAMIVTGCLVRPAGEGRIIGWPLLVGLFTLLLVPAFQGYDLLAAAQSIHFAGAIGGIVLFLLLVKSDYRDAYRTSAVSLIVLFISIGFVWHYLPIVLEPGRDFSAGDAALQSATSPLAWLLASLATAILALLMVVRGARSVQRANSENSTLRRLQHLLDGHGAKQERTMKAVTQAVLQHGKLVVIPEELPPAFGEFAQAWHLKPLLVPCPMCERDVVAHQIGEQTCPLCKWDFSIDKDGTVIDGFPALIRCPHCDKEFKYRKPGNLTCPTCTQTFHVDAKGKASKDPSFTYQCAQCDLSVEVDSNQKVRFCPQCGKPMKEVAEAPEPRASQGEGPKKSTTLRAKETFEPEGEQSGPTPGPNEEAPRTDGDDSKPGWIISLLVTALFLAALRFVAGYVDSSGLRYAIFGGAIFLILSSSFLRSSLFTGFFVVALISAVLFVGQNWSLIKAKRIGFKDAVIGTIELATTFGPGRDVKRLIQSAKQKPLEGLALVKLPNQDRPTMESMMKAICQRVDTRDEGINQLAGRLVKDCPEQDKLCEATMVLRFVTDNVKYRNDPISKPEEGDYPKSPQQTLAAEGGDCEDKTILLASLLGSIGIRAYIVHEPQHAHALVCFPDNVRQMMLESFHRNGRSGLWYLRGLAPRLDAPSLKVLLEGMSPPYKIHNEICYAAESTAPRSWFGLERSTEHIAVYDYLTAQPVVGP